MNNILSMSRQNTCSNSSVSSRQAEKSYYIVKDDFIINLRKGRKNRVRSEIVGEPQQPQFVRDSSLIVTKKKQIFEKMPVRSKNDFCDLPKQITNNSRSLYRKITVAMRRQNIGIRSISNPFQTTPSEPRQSQRKYFNQEKHLQDLIFSVQPYWIKNYISKTPTYGRS